MGSDRDGLSCPGNSKVAEGARFENPEPLETIWPDLTSSHRFILNHLQKSQR